MAGIDMNQTITYMYSSLRYFNKNDHHVKRYCEEDVLLLVFEGILRFSEDGVPVEVHAGEYYIQQRNHRHDGETASDAPKYLYVHFIGAWTEEKHALTKRGYFDYSELKTQMERMDMLCHSGASYIEQTSVFYEILSHLYQKEKRSTTANQIAEFIAQNHTGTLTLEMICKKFNFSKNHVINLFKKEYHMTPFEYMNYLKIKQAECLLELTSQPAEKIAYECGFHNYSHFYRLFQRTHQASPSEWRTKKRKGEHYESINLY